MTRISTLFRRTKTTRRSPSAAVGLAAAMAASLCCVGVAGTAGAAAAHKVAKAPGNATKGTITWWANPITTGTPDPRKVLLKAFERKYPHIHVKMESAPTDTTTDRATLTTQIGGGAGPTVYMGTVTWPAQFGAHEFAVPLSKYEPKSYFKTFAKGLVTGATYKGKVLAAPFYTTQGLLYYRKDLLAADHLPVPKTWSQLASESKEMQAKGQVKYGFVFQAADYEGATCDFMEYLADAGGKVTNKKYTKSELASGKAAVRALTTMDSFVKDGISPQAESTYKEATSMAAFKSGTAAFLRNWPYAYNTSQGTGSKVVGKVGVAPLPTFSKAKYPGYSVIGGWDLFVNPHSKNIAADLTFIKFMTSPAAQKTLATTFSEIPTLTKVQKTKTVKSKNPVLAVVSKTKLITRPAGTPNYAAVSKALYQNVSAAMAGQESTKTAISKASTGVNSALSSSGL